MRPSRPAPVPPARRSAWGLAVALATLAGAVDAIGFLRFGGLFVSFMSGNTTQLGTELSAGAGAVALASALLIAVFLVGVVAGEVLGVGAGLWRAPVVLGTVAALIGLAAVLAAGRPQSFGVPLLLALAMGGLNAALVRTEGFALTYVTGTLVNAGRRLADALRGAPGLAEALRLLALWLGLCGGAVLGALLARQGLTLALGAAAAAAAVLALATAVRR